MAADSVWWGRSRMGWTPDGYVLHLEHSLQERAALLMQRLLRESFDGEDVEVAVTPMRQHHTERQSSADLGTLTLTSETLLTRDAAVLRQRVDQIARDAHRRMENITAQEEALAVEFLEILERKPDAG